MKEVNHVAKRARQNRSEEEILDQAARLVAGTINPDKMGLVPEEVDIENFIKFFKEYLSLVLSQKDAVLLAIGEYVNTDSYGVYSDAIQFILDCIEEKMHTRFYFYHGIALWVCKNDLYAVWLPH